MGLKLLAEIALDGSGFERGLNRLGSAISGSLVRRVGALFTVAAVTQFTRGVIQAAAQIKDLSEQFGVTTDEVQKVQAAMRESGLDFSLFGQALIRVGKARRDAVESDDRLLAFFNKFGISVAELNDPALRSIDLIKRMGEALKTMNPDSSTRTALNDLLGRRGERLMEILTKLEETQINIISRSDIDAIDEMDDALGRLWQNVRANVAPAIAEIADDFNQILKSSREISSGGVAAIGGNAGSPVTSLQDFLNQLPPGDFTVQTPFGPVTKGGADSISGGPGILPDLRFPGGAEELFTDRRKGAGSRSGRSGAGGSDALSAVGNFLGQAGPLISGIAEQQLDIARQSLDQHKTTNAKLDRLNDRLGNLEGGLDIGE